MTFFDEFKRRLGSHTPAEETIYCNPLLVVQDDEIIWPDYPLLPANAGGEVAWSYAAVIKYTPGEKRFEGGSAVAIDPETNARLVQFTVDRFVHQDAFGIAYPLEILMPWGENGVTMYGTDEAGNSLIAYCGSHADSEIARRIAGIGRGGLRITNRRAKRPRRRGWWRALWSRFRQFVEVKEDELS